MRRAADDPGYDQLADFKRDMRDMVSSVRGGRLPDFRSIANMIGTSPSTAYNALTPDQPTRLSEDTARGLAQAYDPSGLNYWLERRMHLNNRQIPARQAIVDDAGVVEADTSTPITMLSEPTSTRGAPPASREKAAARLQIVGIIVALAMAMGVAIGVPWYLSLTNSDSPPGDLTQENMPPSINESTEPSGKKSSKVGSIDDPITGVSVSDYSDPVSAGCISDATRVKSDIVESIGLVSIVHSPSCGAYWARAERTDGREFGNHIDVSLAAKSSDRSPIVANDPNASVVYTYLMTTKQVPEFCVETTFWVGQEATRLSPFCVDTER